MINTLGHALRLAGAELLELDHRELAVVCGPVGMAARIGLQIFDNAAGGAGHAVELAALGKAWFEAARSLMHRDDRHHSDCDTTCLHCLLTTASQHMIEEGFSEEEIREALTGRSRILEDYPDEFRCLILGHFPIQAKARSPLHVVCDYSKQDIIDIVAAYIPQKPWWVTSTKRGVRK